MTIHQLIERYFDGLTTTAEERELRQMLADAKYQGTDIDEARAVMGIFVAKRLQSKPTLRKRPATWSYVSRAACLAVLIIGGAMAWTQHANGNEAYINGQRVSTDVAIAQMQSDLNLFDIPATETDEAIASDMALFCDILN